jgi:ribosomal protein S6
MTTIENKTIETEVVEVLKDTERVQDTKFYELFYLLRPNLSEEELRTADNTIRTAVSDLNGIIVMEKAAEAKKMAFKIAKSEDINKGWIKFMLKPDQVKALETKIKKLSELVRLRIISASKESSAPRKTVVKKSGETGDVQTEELDKKLEEILG